MGSPSLPVEIYPAIFSACPDALLVSDGDGQILAANPAAARLLGRPVEEVARSHWRQLSTWTASEYALGASSLLRAGNAAGTVRLRTASGEVDLEYTTVPAAPDRYLTVLRTAAGNPAHAAAREAQTRLRAILDYAPIIVFAVDDGGRFTFSEGHTLERVGLKQGQLVGLPAREAYATAELVGVDGRRRLGGEVVDAVLGGETFVGTSQLGQTIFENWFVPVRASDQRVTGFIGISIDVTARKQLEARLIAADRLASLGSLAAGVAHELNNPLAYVTANLGFALKELSARPQDAQLAEVIAALRESSEGADRMRLIVNDLRTFSHAGDDESATVDLLAVVESAAALTAGQIRPRARMVIEAEPQLPRVRGNAARLGQVFVNLLVNAAQAIPEGEAARHQVTVRIRPEVAKVVVEVSDTGAGIPESIRSRIFDPFFTTKPVGVGTGLGLSICQAILARFGGDISVSSEVGRGTTFRLFLPSSAAAS